MFVVDRIRVVAPRPRRYTSRYPVEFESISDEAIDELVGEMTGSGSVGAYAVPLGATPIGARRKKKKEKKRVRTEQDDFGDADFGSNADDTPIDDYTMDDARIDAIQTLLQRLQDEWNVPEVDGAYEELAMWMVDDPEFRRLMNLDDQYQAFLAAADHLRTSTTGDYAAAVEYGVSIIG